MASLIDQFASAYEREQGHELAALFRPEITLQRFYDSTTSRTVKNDMRTAILYHLNLPMDKKQAHSWVEVFETFHHAVGDLLAAHRLSEQGREADWQACFDSWKVFSETMLRKGFNASDPAVAFPSWAYPCLYVTAGYMRKLAMLADAQVRKNSGGIQFNEGFQDDIVADSAGQTQNLEETTRYVSSVFRVCVGDRNDFAESKKQALYHVTNLSFKLHFQLNNIRPCSNLINALKAHGLDLALFPKAEQVTFNYYAGVLRFLEEDYEEADKNFSEAIKHCPLSSKRNRELILTYLIPCRMLTSSVLPTHTLLEPYPLLTRLFLPLASAIKRGNLYSYDLAMSVGEEYFSKRRIYLTLERAREICIRNLFHKVFLSGGYEKGGGNGNGNGNGNDKATGGKPVRETAFSIDQFVAAMRLSMRGPDGRGHGGAEVVERDEVECLMANAFYKGHMRGYLRHDLGKVKFSKSSAFPPRLNSD